MDLVTYKDSAGNLRAVYLPDGEDDVALGIPCEPPDLQDLDWKQIIQDIQNQLVERGLFTYADVQKQQNAITSILRHTLKNKILALYKEANNG